MDTQMVSTIDTLSISLILGVLGIAITIFTVIYSFMENTKDRKRNISDKVRNNIERDPVLESDLQFTIEYLADLRSMNRGVIVIIILDIVVFALYSAHMILASSNVLSIIAYGLLVLLLLLCLIMLYVYLAKYFKRYKKYNNT